MPAQSLSKGLSIFGAAAWIGGVLGFALAGVTLQNLGFSPTFIIGGCLAVAAVGLLIPIQVGSRKSGQLEPTIS